MWHRIRFVASLVVLAAACSGGAEAGPSASPTSDTPPVPTGLAPSITIDLTGAAGGALGAADDALWVTHFEGTTISRVDLDAGTEVAVVEVGPHPGGTVTVGGELWVEHFTHAPSITALDPRNGDIRGEIDIAQPCCDLAVADGDVWSLGPEAGLQRIDVRTGTVIDTTDIPVGARVPANIVAADGALWLASQGSPLTRVDARTGRVTDRIEIGQMLPYAVGPDGLVWCAGFEGISAIDPSRGAIVEDLNPADLSEVISMAVDGRWIWLGIRDGAGDGQLVQLDRDSGAEIDRAAVSLPLRMLELDGTLWVSDFFKNRLLGFAL